MSRATSFAVAAVLTLPPTLQAQAVPAGSMGHGISHPLAVWRAGTIQDVRYDLKLDLTPLDSAIGAVTIRFLHPPGISAFNSLPP